MKNSIKRIRIVAVFLFLILFSINFVMATGEDLMDTNAINGVYKLSEDENISYLPILRYVTDRIEIDKETGEVLGAFFSNSSIEVNSKQGGIKCLFSNDTTRVNSSMEYPIIFATQNVIIDSTIEKSIIVFGGANVTFTENSEVKGDIISFSNNLEINGKVSGSVIAFASKVDVNGKIEKDLRLNAYEVNLQGEDNVAGNILVITANENLTSVTDKYENAVIKLIETEDKISRTEILKVVAKGFVVCLIFALIYTLINKKNPQKIEKVIKKTKEHTMAVLLSGSLSLLLFPFIVIILLILSMVNFEFIALPILILYLAFLIISGMLSTFIIGAIIIKFMTDKYLQKENIGMKLGFYFLTYVVLYILARVPVIGTYVTWGLVILANGVVLTNIFKFKEKTSK